MLSAKYFYTCYLLSLGVHRSNFLFKATLTMTLKTYADVQYKNRCTCRQYVIRGVPSIRVLYTKLCKPTSELKHCSQKNIQ